MRIAFVLGAALVLTACEPAPDARAADPTIAEDQPPATDAELEPQARPEADAEAFARELYTAIFEDGFSPLDEANSGLWTPQAWADIEAAWARDIGAISADPFCVCQDPTGMSAGEISAALTGDDAAEAIVEVIQGEDRVPVTLRLRRVDGAWAIDDDVGTDGRSFRQALASGAA